MIKDTLMDKQLYLYLYGRLDPNHLIFEGISESYGIKSIL